MGNELTCEYKLTSIGGSACAGGKLIEQMGGKLMGFIFLLELEFLKGREQLSAPVHTLLSGQA